MNSHVELYEALKPTVGEEAARMIANVIPAAAELATKQDVERLRTEIAAGDLRTIKWLVGIFLPILVGIWGTVIAVLIKI